MQKLKKYLTINAMFSQVTGVIAILLSSKLNSFFNADHNLVFPILGLNLLVFSAFVLYVSMKHLNNKLLVKIISFLDIGWVLGSIVIVAFGLFNLSNQGYAIIAIIAVWIGFLAYKQMQFNK